MPIIQSAKKRARQTKVREARNRLTKKNMRESIKALMEDAKNGGKNAGELFRKAQANIDIAVKKNVLHKNTGARKKSRLNAELKRLGVNPQGSKSTKVKTPAKPASKVAAQPKATAANKPAPKKPAAKKPVAKKAPAKK